MSFKALCLLASLLVATSQVILAADTTVVQMQRGDARVIGYEKCGQDGNCISVALDAPGRNTSIEYSCTDGNA